MANWIRKAFDSHGLTQHKPGPYLAKIQELASWSVILCIDVSGSMSGNNIVEACSGARKFLAEAADNHYDVALLAWSHEVSSYYDFSTGLRAIDTVLERVLPITGGTNIVPALEKSFEELQRRKGDRVIAVFGDGDLGDRAGARRLADEIHQAGIRIVTLGLGLGAATALDEISSEGRDTPRAVDESTISSGIAGLARVLKTR